MGPPPAAEPGAEPLSDELGLLPPGFASEAGRLSGPEPLSVSEPPPDPVSDPDAPSEPELAVVVGESPSDEPEEAAVDRRLVLRSFFAQPVPLKWIVGAENAFRTGAAPQIGQDVGPSVAMEWMTSKR